MAKDRQRRPLAQNRRARYEYHILDSFEAGIVLTGTEVKAVRQGKVQLAEAYVEIRDGQAYLVGAHISPYSHGNRENHEPVRDRKLLLHRREIDKLYGRSILKGLTIVPLAVYLKNHRLKVEVALAQGKKLYDKRQTEKDRVMAREAEEAMRDR